MCVCLQCCLCLSLCFGVFFFFFSVFSQHTSVVGTPLASLLCSGSRLSHMDFASCCVQRTIVVCSWVMSCKQVNAHKLCNLWSQREVGTWRDMSRVTGVCCKTERCYPEYDLCLCLCYQPTTGIIPYNVWTGCQKALFWKSRLHMMY